MKLAFIAATVFGTGATASTEQVLYSFPVNSRPYGQPDQDRKGSLYGTDWLHSGAGGIFRLEQENGAWSFKTLFGFNGGSDGQFPFAGPLVDRSTGVLYGTTLGGGAFGYGEVYSLAPVGRGWSETVLHSFSDSDGAFPVSVLLKDKRTGSLYGTTRQGGTNDDCGTAFQLSQSNGNWTFSTIYNFQRGNGCSPDTQLVPGLKPGTLIGGAEGAPGGTQGQVFLLKERHGLWSESIVHTFGASNGSGTHPIDLAASGDGTIYGVTEGGVHSRGIVFKLTPNLNQYAFSVIYHFSGGNDGASPSGVTFDPATGNLYGTTAFGGTADQGTVFRLSPNGNEWTETVLHSFAGAPSDGAHPYNRPIVDRTTGALYGTTNFGGANDGGTVYMVQP